MADNVPVTPSASYTVAGDDIAGVVYQRVKINIGEDGVASSDVGATTPLPVTGAVGVSGTVTVGAAPAVSGTITVGAAPAVSGTVTVNTIAAGFSVNALVTGAVSVSAMPAVSGTVSILNVVPVPTAASVSVSGIPVWLNPTQPVVVNTIAAGFSVNALVTGAVSVSAMPAVSISVSAVLGTIVTQLGTQMVSIAQTSVVAQVSGAVSISAIAGSVSIVAGASVSVVNTVVVSQVGYLFTTTGVTTGTAQAVWIMNPTTATVTVTVTATFGDAIAFSFTSVSAPTVVTPALMDVAWLGTTVQTSMYVVPAGRRLVIQAVAIGVQNTAASIGFGACEVYVRASLSSSVTVGPVYIYGKAVALSSGTNAANAIAMALSMAFSTTYSVGFGYKATGGTGHIVQFVIQGVLY